MKLISKRSMFSLSTLVIVSIAIPGIAQVRVLDNPELDGMDVSQLQDIDAKVRLRIKKCQLPAWMARIGKLSIQHECRRFPLLICSRSIPSESVPC